jgi:hypothetical protein
VSTSASDDLPCEGDLDSLTLATTDPKYFYFSALDPPTAFEAHFCQIDFECSQYPAAGYMFHLLEGTWTNELLVIYPPDGEMCTSRDIQLVMVGEELYWVRTLYTALGRLDSEGNCLGAAEGSEWTCASRDVELYVRSDIEPTFD